MLTKASFKCRNCGKCCLTYTVKLSDDDIKRIKKLGHKKDSFAEPDNFDIRTGKYALKRVNNQCIFLERKSNNYFCKIYKVRPEICINYPFNESDMINSCEPILNKKEER